MRTVSVTEAKRLLAADREVTLWADGQLTTNGPLRESAWTAVWGPYLNNALATVTAVLLILLFGISALQHYRGITPGEPQRASCTATQDYTCEGGTER